jgi:hypothetical protein
MSEQFQNHTTNTTLSEQFQNHTTNTTLSEQFQNHTTNTTLSEQYFGTVLTELYLLCYFGTVLTELYLLCDFGTVQAKNRRNKCKIDLIFCLVQALHFKRWQSALYNNAARTVICDGWHLIHILKTLA